MAQQDIFLGNLNPPACHSASIIELDNGELYAVWYSGSYEGSEDTVLYAARKTAGNTEWNAPMKIVEIPGLPTGNPVLWYEKGVIHLFFVILYGDWWTESRVAYCQSTDSGESWNTPKVVHPEKGLMLRTAPIRLRSGALLLPVYHERKWCPLVLRTIDNGDTWHLYGDATARGVAIQPTLVEIKDDHVLMYTRSTKGKIYQSWSFNGGLSWTASQATGLPNPNSGIDVLRTRHGELILACNYLQSGRHNLSVLMSQDDGKTWPFRQSLEDGEGEYSYPSLMEAKDGRIHVVYTRQRMNIVHAQFHTAWIKNGLPVEDDERSAEEAAIK